jgi:hypothetical protein
MDFTNKTPLAASLSVGNPPGAERRIGAILAKATYRLPDGPAEDRALELETQEPIPLFDEDEETDLGLRPRDDLVRRDEAFEVILLGAAHTPGGHPEAATLVTLRLGEVRRQLLVVGDRRWKDGLARSTMTEPEPFTRMPLTWARAFGGTAPVDIDEGATVDVSHPKNKAGRGFDAEAAAEDLADTFETPSGYPVVKNERLLPNLEDPDDRIRKPTDEPEPKCWATLPLSSGLHTQRVLDGMDEDEITSEALIQQDGLLYRAHPDWVIERPPKNAQLLLVNAAPGGRWDLTLPALRVVFDYINDGRTATRELMPQMLVLYPEEKRLTLTYRKPFTYPFEGGAERSIRLRTEDGWYADSPS